MKKGKSIFGGIVAGIILILFGIGLLWWNEGRTVRTQKGINEAKDVFIQVKSDSIDLANENKLVATNGKLDLSNASELYDDKFNIRVNSAKLERTVEMYQWKEDCDTDEDNHETCSYKKVWEDSLIDSSNFTKSGHDNPSSMPFDSNTFLANPVKMGEYYLPSDLIETLSTKVEIKDEELSNQFANTIEGYVVDGSYITNVKEGEKPVIGSVRVSFKYNNADSVSVLAVQSGVSFTKYKTKSDTTIYRLKEGTHQGEEIIQDLIDENNLFKWLLRLFGTILVVFGISAILSPIQKLTSFIPILGGAVSIVTGVISLLLGCAISLVVIAIAWFRYRPVLSIGLIVAAIILAILLIVYKKKKTSKTNESSNE